MLRYPCPECEIVFTRLSSLRNHVKTHDNVVNRILQEISAEKVKEVDRQLVIRDDENVDQQLEISDDKLDKQDESSDSEQR